LVCQEILTKESAVCQEILTEIWAFLACFVKKPLQKPFSLQKASGIYGQMVVQVKRVEPNG
jgi:hypothetical protein